MKRKGRGSSKCYPILEGKLIMFQEMSEFSTHISANQLRRTWEGKLLQSSIEPCELKNENLAEFKSEVLKKNKKRGTHAINSFVISNNIDFDDARNRLRDEDQRYLTWFMVGKCQESYSFLEIQQDAFSTQNSIYYIQKIHRCLGEEGNSASRCYSVFIDTSDPKNSSILVIQSDRLEVLRLMSLPHLDRNRQLPLHPFYLRRLLYSPSRITDQRWVYYHMIKSMVFYIYSLIDPLILRSKSGIFMKNNPIYLDIFMKLPDIIDLFAETNAEVLSLIKKSYEDPSRGFLRSLMAFFAVDKVHYIKKQTLNDIKYWFGSKFSWQSDMRRKFHAQFDLITQLNQTTNSRSHGNWIPIKKPITFIKSDGHKVHSRKEFSLETSQGGKVSNDIPLHALFYQLVWSKDSNMAKEERRNLFMSIIVDPKQTYKAKRRKRHGLRLWSNMNLLKDYNSFCENNGDDPNGMSIKQAWKISNLRRFLACFEKASRMTDQEISDSSQLDDICSFDLKNLSKGDQNLPIFVETVSNRTPVLFNNFFPSMTIKIDLDASVKTVGFQITTEFMEFYYLARMKSYFKNSDNWPFIAKPILNEDEEEEEVCFISNDMTHEPPKRIKIVNRIKISQ